MSGEAEPIDPAVTAGNLADIYDAMTTVVENDEPTTFTDDRLFASAARLADALTAKLVAARHIRGDQPTPAVAADLIAQLVAHSEALTT